MDSTERQSNDAVASTDFSVLNLNSQNQRKSFAQRPLTEQDERERGLMRIGLKMSFLKPELSLPGSVLEEQLFEALLDSP